MSESWAEDVPPRRKAETAGAPALGLAAVAERLWCRLAHHVPDKTVVWHQGYGFAHCRRCRQPIVRSLLSGWTVPGPGLRIVWDKGSNRPAPPADSPQPVMMAATRAPAGQQMGARAAPELAPHRADQPVPTPRPSEEPISERVAWVRGPAPEPVVAETVAVPEPAELPISTVEEPSAGTLAPEPQPPVPVMDPPAPTMEREAPLLSVLEPESEPIDLLGPNFMGDQGPPPAPRQGLSVFEFDDMNADDDAMGFGLAARSGR